MDTSQYTYVLPEGYTMPEDKRVKLDKLTSNMKLTNIQAQKLVDLHVELVDEYAELMENYTRGLVACVGSICFLIGVGLTVTAFLIF